MAYFLGAAIGNAVGAVASTAIDNARRNRAIARWNSPLSRLGRCGIYSLRLGKAVSDTWNAVYEAGSLEWTFSGSVEFGGIRAPERIVLFAAEAGALIEVIIGDEYVAAVRRTDEAVQALHAHLRHPGIPLHGFVCRADAQEEPRELPAPSGNRITVTGMPWLSGLLRARLGDNDKVSCVPDGFRPEMKASAWRETKQHDLYYGTIERFPQWWTIRDLRLDDGLHESIDIVSIGPAGVLAVEVSNMEPGAGVGRVSRHAHRLRDRLPQVDVVPVIVTDEVTQMRFGPEVDTAGYPIAWIHPEQFYEFARQLSRRGPGHPEIAFLNAPAPGWWRRTGFGQDGVEVLWGWQES